MDISLEENEQLIIFLDRQQELDINESVRPDLVDGPEEEKGVECEKRRLSTLSHIKGAGNKPINHKNSVAHIVNVPKYGVETNNEEELGEYLKTINKWGVNAFTIAELSNNRPLTAGCFAIFSVRF